MAADEARFRQIESLINKLRDEERWRLKVTDVRDWFDFAAVETDDRSGEELSYHDDSAGQSGGEKAKLAFKRGARVYGKEAWVPDAAPDE